ncbi:MAG TPA: hypothetical protein VIZ31_02955 [Vicinamibacteria bacterium]|jgi:hypothetical protein
MKETLELLAAMASKKGSVPDQKELYLDIGERAVKATTSAFSCKADEVAILVLTSDNRHLRFVAPRKFTDLGTIPITKRDSIAVTVLGRKAGEAMNNVPMVRHVSFFESVKIRDRVSPIQKMVTVPILYKGTPIGVAQISRKGDTPAEAGADFTAQDVRKAQDFFESLAPFLYQARPDKF